MLIDLLSELKKCTTELGECATMPRKERQEVIVNTDNPPPPPPPNSINILSNIDMVGLILGFGFPAVLARGIKPPNIAIERPLKARKAIHGRQLQLHPTAGVFAPAGVGGNGDDGGGGVRTVCRLI